MAGMNVHQLDPSGPVIVDGQSVVDLIGEIWGQDADLLVVPVERLAPEFFRLSTGLAGEVLQKFVNYGYQVAIVGDIDAYLAASSALRDFVRESNSGRHVWFLPDRAALDARLDERDPTATARRRRLASRRSRSECDSPRHSSPTPCLR